jgi:hypothetical protein
MIIRGGIILKSILVFIDGTICDTRQRHHLFGTQDFYSESKILDDCPSNGSLDCLLELSKKYKLIYIAARPVSCLATTQKWLNKIGFPNGEVYLGKNQEERMQIVLKLKENNNFIAGIGDRWDDNELHLAIGCMSIILKKWDGNWDTVQKYIN